MPLRESRLVRFIAVMLLGLLGGMLFLLDYPAAQRRAAVSATVEGPRTDALP
jgi:hypothetical protein